MRSTWGLLVFALLAPRSAAELDRVRYNSPGLEVDLGVGLWAWPLPLDYDEDGDLDLVVSSGGLPYEGKYFFENRALPGSDSAMPTFLPGVRPGEYRTNIQISHNPGHAAVITTPGELHPTFRQDAYAKPVDLDGNTERVYSSTGRLRAKQWKLADWEGDGGLDPIIGVGDWGDYGWDDAFDRSGKWTNAPLHGYVYMALRQADRGFGDQQHVRP